jgi:hypothetical protein
MTGGIHLTKEMVVVMHSLTNPLSGMILTMMDLEIILSLHTKGTIAPIHLELVGKTVLVALM